MRLYKAMMFLGIVCCCMLLNAPVSSAKTKYQGICGPHAKWSYSQGVLTISGKGEITSNPWMKKEACRKKIRRAVISEGITSICEDAFSTSKVIGDHDFLGDGVELPDSLQRIGGSAFAFVEGLKTVYIPPNVQVIEALAFDSCRCLRQIEISEEGALQKLGNYAFGSCKKLEEITVPSTVTYMGEGVFIGCESIENIVMLASITAVPNDCFLLCKNLNNIQLSENTTEIGKRAFAYCGSLEEFSFPENLTSIGAGAFGYCSSIRELCLPDSVTQVGEGAFERCASLETIRLSDGMTVLPAKLFRDCVSLEAVDIPASVREIEEKAFASCSSLKKLVIPENVTRIQPCHRDCPRLKTIENRAQVAYPLSASKLVMDWYHDGEKVTEAASGATVTSKGKRFKISYDRKNIKKYSIRFKGKLPRSYVYGEEPRLPEQVTSTKKNVCFDGWWYRADKKKFQKGVTRNWYNAQVSQFSPGLKGDVTVHPMADGIEVKKKDKKKGVLVLDFRALLKDYLPADCIDLGRTGYFDCRIMLFQVRYADNKKMKNAKSLSPVMDDVIIRIKMKKLEKGKTYYIQYKRVPAQYGGMPLEERWAQIYKIKM